MTEREFEENYCNNSHINIDEYRKYFVTLPCQCGSRSCKGWACVDNNKVSIKAHMDLYMR